MKSIRTVVYNLAFFCFCIVASFATRPALAEPPKDIVGVMTRWQTTSATACEDTFDEVAEDKSCPRSLMFTITPALDGVSLHDWVTSLTSKGVNTGVIYVLPGNKIGNDPTVDEDKWKKYNEYIYMQPSALNDNQKKLILEVGKDISKRKYTVAERDYAILKFLENLSTQFPGAPPMKFILDERVWFINHLNSDGEPIPLTLDQVFTQEKIYSDDIAGIVNKASSRGLDPWLSGVRLSEYAAKNWNLMGPVMVDLVTEINAKSSNWMKDHTFIGAGGGWGQYWNGIDDMQCPTTPGWQFEPCTGAFPFFKYMNKQVQYFAFGDKFMEFGKAEQYMLAGHPTGLKYQYITGEIADFCIENSAGYKCENAATPTVKDWKAFLSDNAEGLGFRDLVLFLGREAKKYPHLGNVIFEGDNSDSFATMSLPSNINGGVALSSLFINAMQGRFENVEHGTVEDIEQEALKDMQRKRYTGIEDDIFKDEGDGDVKDADKDMNVLGRDVTHDLEQKSRQKTGTWTGKIFLDAFDNESSIPRTTFFGDTGLSMFNNNYNDFTFEPTNVQLISNDGNINAWVEWPHFVAP